MDAELFAGVAVTDFDRAVAWFERLLGEPPTFEAHETEVVWTLSEGRSIYVELRPERAGYAMVTLFLDDFDGFLASAASRGVEPDTQETYGNGVRKAIFLDPDGNEIGFGGAPADAVS
jgi:catechol 2,3-dioxygenase-like lactoylglutathione lyase family enzyme